MQTAPRASFALALFLVGASGCGWVPKARFESAQSQNRTLTEQNKAQLAEIENLKVHARGVEDNLIKAEQELAQNDSGGRNDGYRGLPPGVSGRLSDLAQRYPSLHYDTKTGISKLDTDILFASGDAELKPGAQRMLREFADIFQSPDARDLKIMVVGHTDDKNIKGREVRERYPNNWHLSAGRALAVADKLRQAGIPEDRMGVAGFGQHQPLATNESAEARQRNRRVEIFVLGPETPVVGWNDLRQTIYR